MLRIVLGLLIGSTLAGCSNPLRLFPATPVRVAASGNGETERLYDINDDGRIDASERLSTDGRIVAIGKDCDGDGDVESITNIADPKSDVRHLVIILDSIPFDLVEQAYRHGRFRMFYPPSRTIAPFPVMTDVCLAEFFGISPSPGAESSYYDGTTLTDGARTYGNRTNMAWMDCLDYHLTIIAHAFSYLDPYTWVDHELSRISEIFDETDHRLTSGYMVSTSGVGAVFGHNGHQTTLVRLDRYCQQLIHEHNGQVMITLMSDHGHNLIASQRIPLADYLDRMGYNVGKTLKKPGDVVVPEFGPVTCAAIYTGEPEKVAADVVGIEGIELTAYQGVNDSIVVLSPTDKAIITRSDRGFRYEAVHGDPLELREVIAEMIAAGEVDDGWLPDERLFARTNSRGHVDGVSRLWRSFHGLIENTPNVLVVVKDGFHCGDKGISDTIAMAATHGNMRYMGSSGFVITMMGKLPEVMRMEDLRGELVKIGVPIENSCCKE